MLLWVAGQVVLASLVVFVNHVISPQILYYTTADERFTGVSASQIRALSPNLLSWMVLFYDTTAGQMALYGILTIFVAATAYRRGERWAWLALLVSFAVSSSYLLVASSPFLNRNIFESSGISIGILGVVIILAFLVMGLLLPGADVLKKTPGMATEHPKGSRKLSFSWLAMLIVLAAPNISAAVYVPLYGHLLFPSSYPSGSYFFASDAAFSGVSWQQIVSSSPTLGFWIILQMDNMCARMMAGGILASAVIVKAFRRSQRWAYFALLAANLLVSVPSLLWSIPFYQAGIFETGLISGGFYSGQNFITFLVFIFLNILAFVLPISHFRRTKPAS